MKVTANHIDALTLAAIRMDWMGQNIGDRNSEFAKDAKTIREVVACLLEMNAEQNNPQHQPRSREMNQGLNAVGGAQQETPIQRQLSALSSANAQLEQTIGALHERLKRAMRDPQPETELACNNEPDQVPGSDIGQCIRNEANRVRRARRMIDDILQRVEV